MSDKELIDPETRAKLGQLRQKLINEFHDEREYQNTQWGIDFDRLNTLNDWIIYVMIYMGEAASMKTPSNKARKLLKKAMTLLGAACEMYDLTGQWAPRHYEDRVPNCTRPGNEK